MRDRTRTFLALPVSRRTVQRLSYLTHELSSQVQGVRWTHPEQFHLTLSFIGDVDSVRLNDLASSVADAVAACGAFDVEWKGLGCFPHAGRPRILWMGVGLGTAQILELHRTLVEPLREFQAKVESTFWPHVTLARTPRMGTGPRNIGPLLDAYRDWSAGVDSITAIQIMSSELNRQGSTYSVISTIPLRCP